MILTKLNSSKTVNVRIAKYTIKWDKSPSNEQKILQDFLYPLWKNHIVLAEMRVPGSKMRCDIVNVTKMLILEYSPASHHGTFNKFFHKNRVKYWESIKRDVQKEDWAAVNGFKMVTLDKDHLSKLSVDMFKEEFGAIL